MASITKKTIKGKTYYYARECRRVNGRPKIVWQKYLGKLENIVTAVDQQREGFPIPLPAEGAEVVELGAAAALYDLADQLDLVGIIDRHVPKRGKGPSVGTYLTVAAINRCIAPRSKAQMGEWFNQTVLRRLMDIQGPQLSSQRFWDNMDRVSGEALEAIESELTRKMVDQFNLDLSRLLFDATNFFTFIDTFNGRSTLAQRGKSKEGRMSLRIVGLALLVTSDFHIPLFHHTYPGNQPDSPTFSQLIGRLHERCLQLLDGVEGVTIVFDKGNNSTANFAALEQTPFHFVGSLVPTQHSDLLMIPRSDMKSLAPEGLPGVSAYRTMKKVFGTERTVVVTYNHKLYIAQFKTLLREIDKRQKQLLEIHHGLQVWQENRSCRGKPPKMEGVQKKVSKILGARHMKDLFHAEITEKDGMPVLDFEFLQDQWEELQQSLLGKTLLFTDHQDWSDSQIVQGYRSQHLVENAFRHMKNPSHISIRPQHHWTDQKVRVHVFVCVIALTLACLLRRILYEKNLDLSIPKMLKNLAEIKEIQMVFPPQGKQTTPAIRSSISSMNELQTKLFEALDLQRFLTS